MNCKLTRVAAQRILDRAALGEPQKDLAEEYGVSPATVSLLVTGGSWSGLVRVEGERVKPRGAKLTEEDVITILLRLSLGEIPGRIAPDFNVTRQAIANIKAGKTWLSVPRPERPIRQRVWESRS